jgi:hypothetical protein
MNVEHIAGYFMHGFSSPLLRQAHRFTDSSRSNHPGAASAELLQY